MLEAVQQAVKVVHEVDYPLVVLGNQFVHITSDLVVIVIILCLLYSYCPAFELGFLPPVLDNRHDTLHVFGTVIGLMVDLAVCQSSIIPKCLQRAWADVEHLAHVLIVHPLAHRFLSMPMADGIHAADETIEFGDQLLKGSFFDRYDFHIHYYLLLFLFLPQRKGLNPIKQWLFQNWQHLAPVGSGW